MTEAQALAQYYNLDEHILLRHSYIPPQPCISCIGETPTSLPQFSNGRQGLTMAQSMLADQFRSDSYMQAQAWTLQPASSENIKSTGAAAADSHSSMAYPSGQNWTGATEASTSFDWHHAIQQVEPYSLRESDSKFGQNNELLYSHLAAQNTITKGYDCTGQAKWASAQLSGLPHGANSVLSNVAMRTSISPKSYTSDEFDNSYTPGSMPDQASPSGNWHGLPMSSPNTVVSSPKAKSYYANVGHTGVPRMEGNVGLSLTPSTDCTGQGQALRIPEKAPLSGSEHSYSHDSSPSASPWYASRYIPSTEDIWNTPCRSDPWIDPHATPTQDRIQARFQMPRSASAQAQREHNDRMLLEGKKRGETYKEIKKKLIGENPAESTLRGRYRSLTKARRDRVRKPVWTKTDIGLLIEVVDQEFDRIESNLQDPCVLSVDQKLMKVSWKKVAYYIDENGGSYHFGNSTCKRKWLELHPTCQ